MVRLGLLCALLLLGGCYDFGALLGSRALSDGGEGDLAIGVEAELGTPLDAWMDGAAGIDATTVDAAPDSASAPPDLSAQPDLVGDLSPRLDLKGPDLASAKDLTVAIDLGPPDLAAVDQQQPPDLRGAPTVHNYQLPAGPVDVRVGDVNGDTFPDLVVLCASTKQVMTLINDGSGMFAYAMGAPLALPATPGLLAALLDYDGDGKLDVVVTLPLSTDLLFAPGKGDGTWLASTRIGLPGVPISIAAADYNLDKRPDVAVGILAMTPGVTVLLGGANGLQAPGAVMAAGTMPAPLVVADLDGDGKPDLVAGQQSQMGSSIVVLKGKGDGKFPALSTVAGAPINGIAAVDMDLDGQMDLVCGDQPNTSVAVLAGTGNLAFAAPVLSLAPGKGQAHLAVGDFDGDGDPDVALVERDSAQLSVFDGSGKLKLKPKLRVSYPTGTTPSVVRAADLDGDGRPDLVTANTMMPGLTVVLRP